METAPPLFAVQYRDGDNWLFLHPNPFPKEVADDRVQKYLAAEHWCLCKDHKHERIARVVSVRHVDGRVILGDSDDVVPTDKRAVLSNGTLVLLLDDSRFEGEEYWPDKWTAAAIYDGAPQDAQRDK